MEDSMLTDPLLRFVSASLGQTRRQSLEVLDYLAQNPLSASTEPSDAAQLALSKQQKLLTAQLARLRGLHRRSVYDVRGTKQETAEAKSEIDSLHLQLQNLFYEQRHLRGEIAACEDYNHKYQSLPLISADDFLAANPDQSSLSDHDLMIARINDEHTQRGLLDQQVQELLKRKQALVAENKNKKDELDALDKEVEKFLEGASSVEKIFDAKFAKESQAASTES